MSLALAVEQLLNGIQLGVQLFLMSAGLTLVFGIMNLINLAHGSLYMAGAFLAAVFLKLTGSFVLEIVLLRRFYRRSHLDQVLVTFGLILVVNEVTRIIFGPVPLPMAVPAFLSGSLQILPGVFYPAFRLAILVVGLIVTLCLYIVIAHTRAGMWV